MATVEFFYNSKTLKVTYINKKILSKLHSLRVHYAVIENSHEDYVTAWKTACQV